MISVQVVGTGFVVQVSPPHSKESWTSPHPLTATEVLVELSRLGCHSTDISDALDATGKDWRQAHDAEVMRRRQELVDALKAARVEWQADVDNPYLFHAEALGQRFDLTIGDFPDEVMFTLASGGIVLAEFDDRPTGWRRPPREPGPIREV